MFIIESYSLTKGNLRLHLVGILGGMIWNTGMVAVKLPATAILGAIALASIKLR